MNQRVINRKAVAKHNTLKNAWVVVNNDVLDISKYLSEHPEHVKNFLGYLGKDVTLRIKEKEHTHLAEPLGKLTPKGIAHPLQTEAQL